MPLTEQNIIDLRALARQGTLQVCEYIKVEWDADDPAETRYYAAAAYHEMNPYSGIGVTIEPRLMGNPFREFELNPDLRSESIKLTFNDIDKVIRGRFQTFGSGVRVEVFFYYPQVGATHSAWFGQLQAPQVYGWRQTEAVATNGFRSREQVIPKRMRPKECTSNFGGRLPDAAAIRTNLCPYDRHVGGTVGLLNSGDPFTDCPRTEAACTARFGDTRFYGGFNTDASAVVTDQRTGYLAVSQGNASKLKQPIRVVAGSKWVRAMMLLLWRREVNQSNPDRSFVATVWEVGEGPMRNIRNIKINEQTPEAIHLAVRTGSRGQVRLVQYAPNISNFSSTAHFFARHGWVNPLDITPSDLSAEAVVDGFSEVTVWNTTVAGNGLVGEYFADTIFTESRAERIDNNINFPTQYGPPIDGMLGYNFSIRWTGFITFDHSETYTLSCDHDDVAKLIVNGSTIFDATGVGVSSGTFAATADTPYTITLEFKQGGTNQVGNPWRCILRWQSASQSLQVIPTYALSHPGSDGFRKQWSDDRVWWLQELYTNQKFGASYPYTRFNTQNFRDHSDWGRQQVSFEVEFPDGETETFPHRRTTFDAILEGRPVAEQIVDICRSGRIAVPFQNDGQFEIAAFRAYTDAELAAARVFTDTGETRNILWSDGQPALQVSSTPNDKVVNEVTVTFEDATQQDGERPVTVDDPDQKLRAGRALGENNLQSVPKRYAAFGIRHLGEAIKFAYGILRFGEFDEGGTQNNFRAMLTVPYVETLGLKRYDVIKIESELLDGFVTPQGNPWEYFRVLRMRKRANDTVEITAQGYNEAAYIDFEQIVPQPGETPPGPTEPPPFPPELPPTEPGPNPNPLPQEQPQVLTIGSATYDATKGYISVTINS